MYACTSLWRPLGLQADEASRISRQSTYKSGKFVSPPHRPPLHPGYIPVNYFCSRLSLPQSHSAAGRFNSMKNSIDSIGNRMHDLPDCKAVPRQTVPPRAPVQLCVGI